MPGLERTPSRGAGDWGQARGAREAPNWGFWGEKSLQTRAFAGARGGRGGTAGGAGAGLAIRPGIRRKADAPKGSLPGGGGVAGEGGMGRGGQTTPEAFCLNMATGSTSLICVAPYTAPHRLRHRQHHDLLAPCPLLVLQYANQTSWGVFAKKSSKASQTLSLLRDLGAHCAVVPRRHSSIRHAECRLLSVIVCAEGSH